MNSGFKILIGLIAIFALVATVGAIYTFGGKTWQENDVLILPKDELKTFEQTGVAPEGELGEETPGAEGDQEQIFAPAVQSEFSFPVDLTAGPVYYNPGGEFGGWFGAKRKDKITGKIRLHDGIDLGAPSGTRLYAAYDGEVMNAEFLSDCGNAFVLKVNNPKVTWFKYCHLSGFASGITKGHNTKQQVKKGELIGYMGTTGVGSSGSHLHIAAYLGGKWASRNNGATPVNPLDLFTNINWPKGKRGAVSEIQGSGTVTGGDVYKYGDTRDRFDSIILQCAAEYRVDPNFIKADIEKESSFDEDALGPILKNGARGVGLMQLLNPPYGAGGQVNILRKGTTKTQLTFENLKTAEVNICAGAEYWAYLSTRANNPDPRYAIRRYAYSNPESIPLDNLYYQRIDGILRKRTGKGVLDYKVFDYTPAPAQATSATPTATSAAGKKIVLFGDSITLTSTYASKVRSMCQGAVVDVKGIVGRHINEMVTAFDTDVASQKPDYVVVLGGANDFGTASITPEQIVSRLNQVYGKAQAANIKVIGVSVTPFGGYSQSPWNTQAQIAKIAAVNALIKNEVGSQIYAYADAYSKLDDGTGKLKSEYSNGGLHLTGPGGDALGAAVASAIPECNGQAPATSSASATPSASGVSKVTSFASADVYTYVSSCQSSVAPTTGRVEAILVPKTGSSSNVNFYFHGLNPASLRSGTSTFAQQYAQTYFSGEEIKESVVIFSGSSNHVSGGNPNEWMKSAGEFKCFYDEAITKLQSLNVNPTTMSLVGHSNGGGTIYNVFTSGFLTASHLPLTNVVSLDGCYPGWCENIAGRLPAGASMFVYYKEDNSSGTKKGSEAVKSTANVNVKATIVAHDDIPKQCLFSYLTNGACPIVATS